MTCELLTVSTQPSGSATVNQSWMLPWLIADGARPASVQAACVAAKIVDHEVEPDLAPGLGRNVGRVEHEVGSAPELQDGDGGVLLDGAACRARSRTLSPRGRSVTGTVTCPTQRPAGPSFIRRVSRGGRGEPKGLEGRSCSTQRWVLSDASRTGTCKGARTDGKIEMQTKHAGRKLALTVLVLLALAVFLTAGTMALFTDSQGVPGNGFTTGTIDLNTAPASAVVTLGNMAPGDVTTNSLVVSNGGSLPLRYAITSLATNADGNGLKDQLQLEVKTIDVTTPAVPCDNFDGTPLSTERPRRRDRRQDRR